MLSLLSLSVSTERAHPSRAVTMPQHFYVIPLPRGACLKAVSFLSTNLQKTRNPPKDGNRKQVSASPGKEIRRSRHGEKWFVGDSSYHTGKNGWDFKMSQQKVEVEKASSNYKDINSVIQSVIILDYYHNNALICFIIRFQQGLQFLVKKKFENYWFHE